MNICPAIICPHVKIHLFFKNHRVVIQNSQLEQRSHQLIATWLYLVVNMVILFNEACGSVTRKTTDGKDTAECNVDVGGHLCRLCVDVFKNGG